VRIHPLPSQRITTFIHNYSTAQVVRLEKRVIDRPLEQSIVLAGSFQSRLSLAERPHMYRVLQISIFAFIAITSLPGRASADFWARVDRTWLQEEIDQAVFFCRTQRRVGADVRLFLDVLRERQIDKCMHALGWVGVAR
jgi:hypothetical protein